MKIYVITHKKFNSAYLINKLDYKPLLVGADLGNKGQKDYLRDNTGNNISKKNKTYCELTGIYWIWKNSSEDIVGIDHYRRYFVKNLKNKSLLNKTDIYSDLKKYDIILPKKDPLVFQGKTVDRFFGDVHDPLVWTKTRDIVKDMYPTYVEDFDWYSKQTTGYCYNMFISYAKTINKYNKWLFSILEKLEYEIDIDKYDNYNQRMIGFVSERLINIWVHHNNLKVKEYPVFFTEKLSLKDKFYNEVYSIVAKRRLRIR